MRFVSLLTFILILLLLCTTPSISATTKGAKSPAKSSNSQQSKRENSQPVKTPIAENDGVDGDDNDGLSIGDDKVERAKKRSRRLQAVKSRLDQQESNRHERKNHVINADKSLTSKRRSRLSNQKKLSQRASNNRNSYWQSKRASVTPEATRRGQRLLEELIEFQLSQNVTKPTAKKASPTYNLDNFNPKSIALMKWAPEEFYRFVDATPRYYWMFVSFTALGSQYNCHMCTHLHNALNATVPLLATHLYNFITSSDILTIDERGKAIGKSNLHTQWKSRFIPESMDVNQMDLQKEWDNQLKRQLPIFIAEVDIDSNRELFSLFDFKSAPIQYLIPPAFNAKSSTPLQSLIKTLPSKYKYLPQNSDKQVTEIVDFLNKFTNTPIASPMSPFNLLHYVQTLLSSLDIIFQYVLAFVACICVLLVVKFLYDYCVSSAGISISSHFFPAPSADPSLTTSMDPYNIKGLSFSRACLFIITSVLFIVCISGGMFNVIRSSDFGSFSWKSFDLNFVTPQFMEQSVVEGYFMGGLQGSLALAVILMNAGVFYWTSVDEEKRKRSQNIGTKAFRFLTSNTISSILSPLVFAAIAATLWLQCLSVFTRKNRGYDYGRVWQWDHLAQFSLLQLSSYLPWLRPLIQNIERFLWKPFQSRIWTVLRTQIWKYVK